MTKKFKSHLSENSFYALQSEKDDFLENEKAIMNAFIFSFIGIISMVNIAKPESFQKIKMYFKQDQQLRPANISDNNNDVSLIIKIMSDKGFFKTPAVANKITKFLVIMKQGKVDEVDGDIVRDWIDSIKPDKLLLLPTAVKKRLKAFQDGGSLVVFGADIKDYSFRFVDKMKDTEYYKIAKVVKYDTAKIKAARAADATAVASSDPVSTTPIAKKDQDSTAQVTQVTADPVDPVKKPTKIKMEKFDLKGVLQDINSNGAADIDDRWKINKSNRSEMLTNLLSNYPYDSSIYGDFWKNSLEYLQKHPVDQNVLQKALFGEVLSRYSSTRRNVDKLLAFSKSGVFDLFTKTGLTKKLNEILLSAIRSIVNDASDFRSIAELADYKKSLESFLTSPIVKGHQMLAIHYGSKLFGATYVYLFFPSTATQILVKKGYITKLSNGALTYNENNPSILYMELMKFYDANPISDGERLVGELTQFRFKWDNYDSDQIDLIGETLRLFKKRDKAIYDAVAISLLSHYVELQPTNTKWVELTNELAENVDIEKIVDSYLGRYQTAVQFNPLPNKIAKTLLTRLHESMKLPATYDDWLAMAKSSSQLANSILLFLSVIHAAAEGVSYSNNEFKGLIAEYYIKEIKVKYNTDSYFTSNTQQTVPNDNNTLYKLLSQKQQDEIDAFGIDEEYLERQHAKGPLSKYSKMSPENKKIAAGHAVKFGIKRLDHIADKALLDIIPPETFLAKGGIEDVVDLRFDTTEYMDKLLKLPEAKEKLDAAFSAANFGGRKAYGSVKVLSAISRSDSITDDKFNEYVTRFVDNNGNDTYNLGQLVTKIETGEGDLNKKQKIMLEKTMLFVDENVKKLTTDYKDFMTGAQDKFLGYVKSDRVSAEAAYQKMSINMKRRIAAAYLSDKDFIGSIRGALEGENALIKPYEKLTNKRLQDMLKYNNVTSEETKITAKYLKTFDAMDEFAEANKDEKPLEDLHVAQIESTPKELNQLTANMHRTKRSGNHGNAGLKFLRSFNVSIPFQVKDHAEWLEKLPDQEIINPMFHGSGAIAAAMILRYGFAVIKSGDASVAGRMLGDGIYGAINIDKSAQYASDSRFSRAYGNKGYIFEMDAALGKKGTDYRAMGLGNDGIRSPEWAVYTPNSQFLILKAYEVEIISPSDISALLTKNPAEVKVNENKRPLKFKSYLKEYTMSDYDIMNASENYTTFTFVNGLIPMSAKGGDLVELEDFKSPDPNRITMEPSAYGPSIVVRGTSEHNDHLFTGPTDLIVNYPELFEEYIRYFNGIYE